MYLIVYLMLIGITVYEYKKGVQQDKLYWIAFFALSMMLCFRYGQGSDYFGYYANYLNVPPITKPLELMSTNIHGEPGWLLICSVFKSLRIPFEVLVAAISMFVMWCMHRFISRYSPMKTGTLLLLYPTIYLTYLFSALRQGIVLSVFLGFLFGWFYEKKYVRFIIVTVICGLIHSSALIFVLMFAVKFVWLDTKKVMIATAGAVACGFLSSWILVKFVAPIATYAFSGVSILGFGERMVSAAVIMVAFYKRLNGKVKKKKPILELMLQIYFYGIIVYAFFAWSSLLASRFAVYFKSVEAALFVLALKEDQKICKRICTKTVHRLIALYCLGLSTLMVFKNVDSYIVQGGYYEDVNVFNYPYVTVFNQQDIFNYRGDPYGIFKKGK